MLLCQTTHVTHKTNKKLNPTTRGFLCIDWTRERLFVAGSAKPCVSTREYLILGENILMVVVVPEELQPLWDDSVT